MRKYVYIGVTLLAIASCQQKMDACDCGKKMINKDSKEAMDCNDYWRSLDLKEQEVFMEEAMKCYANERLGTDLK